MIPPEAHAILNDTITFFSGAGSSLHGEVDFNSLSSCQVTPGTPADPVLNDGGDVLFRAGHGSLLVDVCRAQVLLNSCNDQPCGLDEDTTRRFDLFLPDADAPEDPEVDGLSLADSGKRHPLELRVRRRSRPDLRGDAGQPRTLR